MIDRKYTSSVIAKKLHGHKNVMIVLIRKDWDKKEEKRYCWSNLIKNYKNLNKTSKAYSRGCILENFTLQEINQLKKWFKKYMKASIKSGITKYPILGSSMGLGSIPVGGATGFIMFPKMKNYNLSFDVWGFYDLRNHKRINKN